MFSIVPIPTAAEAFELGVLLFIEATAIVALATLCLRLARRRSAALRAGIGSAATLGLLLLPLAEWVAPSWQLPGSEHMPSAWIDAPVRVPAVSSPGPPVAMASPGDPLEGGPTHDSPSMEEAASQGSTGPVVLEGPVRDGGTTLSGGAAGLPFWVFAVWLIGVLLAAGRILLEEVGLRVALRGAAPAPPEVLAAVRDLGAGTQRHRPEVWLLEGLASPAVAGPVQPVLLLPADVDTWPAARLRSVLAHELAHLERGDVLDHHVGRWVQALFWPNPLVHRLVRRIRAERERACDDHAIAAGTPAEEYASTLVDLAERTRDRRLLGGTVAMARRGPSALRERVCAVLDDMRDRRPVRRLTTLTLALAFLATAVPVAGARAIAEERVVPGSVLRALSARDPGVRRSAVKRLGGVCAPAVVQYVTDGLADPDPSVRLTAAGVVARRGAPSGIAALLVAIRTEGEASVRTGMLRALSSSGSLHAERALLQVAVDEPSETLRAEAIEGLRRRPRLQPRTVLALADRFEVEPLAEHRSALLRAIGWKGLRTVPGVLHRAANDEAVEVRLATVAFAAERAGSALARDALGCLKQDREEEVRDLARAALRGVGTA